MKLKLTKRKTSDFSELISLVDEYIEDLQRKGVISDDIEDIEHYIFEAAIEAIYGGDCWDEINKIEL